MIDTSDTSMGRLVYEQLDCDGWIGMAGVLVGPNGTIVVWDVGNDGHADVVRDALARHGSPDRADVTVITHFHEDHGGALDKLVDQGVDLGRLIVRDRAVSHEFATTYPGTVDAPCDDGVCALPMTLDLGDGARLDLVAADGQVLDAPFPGALPDDDDGENARSLVGIVTWRDFVLVLPGDLTGGGKGTPDVESHVAAHLPAADWGASADVVVLAHHGIDSSTNAAWVERWLPADGVPRDAIVGANGSYLDAPGNEVLDRLAGRVTTVWATRTGSLGGGDLVTEVNGAIEVTPDGVRALP